MSFQTAGLKACPTARLDDHPPFRVVTTTLQMRKVDGERRTAAGRTLHGDGAAVGFDDGLHEAKAKPETTFRPALVAAEQPVPDPRKLGWRYADAGVMNA